MAVLDRVQDNMFKLVNHLQNQAWHVSFKETTEPNTIYEVCKAIDNPSKNELYKYVVTSNRVYVYGQGSGVICNGVDLDPNSNYLANIWDTENFKTVANESVVTRV